MGSCWPWNGWVQFWSLLGTSCSVSGILPSGPHLSLSECASWVCCHWVGGQTLPPPLAVCWSVCHIATAADSMETWRGPRFSFSGLATRLRWPRLSFWRCTVMVPAVHTREGWGEKPDGFYLSGHYAVDGILLTMALVNLPPPQLLSRGRAMGLA